MDHSWQRIPYVCFLLEFLNNPPNSTSVADTMTFIVIMYSTCDGPFSGVISDIGVVLMDFGPITKYPPTLLRDSGSKI